MKKITVVLSVILTLVVTAAAYAVVPFPHHAASPLKGKAVMTVGSKVYLFHSGTEDVK